MLSCGHHHLHKPIGMCSAIAYRMCASVFSFRNTVGNPKGGFRVPAAPIFRSSRVSAIHLQKDMDASSRPFKLILGSASIARRKILADMGYEFTLMSADIDEKSIRKEKPEELVMALAEAKADAIASILQNTKCQEETEPTILVTADTAEAILQRICKVTKPVLITYDQVVVYEGAVREKPSGVDEARQYIQGYSNAHAAAVSSVLVTNLKTGFRKGDVDRVEIYFHEIPDDVIRKLIEEGMVLKVAGALIIEHPLILPYVKEVVGTTDSVMGLPKALTQKLLKEAV